MEMLPLQVDFETHSLLLYVSHLKNKDLNLKVQQRETVKHVWDDKGVLVFLQLALAYSALPISR